MFINIIPISQDDEIDGNVKDQMNCNHNFEKIELVSIKIVCSRNESDTNAAFETSVPQKITYLKFRPQFHF